MVRKAIERWSENAWVIGGLVAFVSLIFLVENRLESPVNPDTARDLLQAVACVNGNAELCLRGPHTSMYGLYQGSLWVRFLAMMHVWQIPPSQANFIVLGLISLGAGVTAISALRCAGRIAAILAGVVFVALALPVIEYPLFWNPSLLPLPLAVFVWALLEHLRIGQTRTVIIAAFSLALCADLHVVCVAFLPLLAVVTVLNARRPAVAAVLVFVSFGLPLFLLSPLTWTINLVVFERSAVSWVAAFASPLICTAGILLRPRWLGLSSGIRMIVVLLCMLSWVAAPVIVGRSDMRYLAPVLPAIAIGPAWLLAAGASRLMLVLRSSLSAPTLVRGRLFGFAVLALLASRVDYERPMDGGAHGEWIHSDVERTVEMLGKNGYGGLSSFIQVQGLAYNALASAAALGHQAESQPHEDVLIVRASAEEIPEDVPDEWKIVELQRQQVAILRPLKSMLRRDVIDACFVSDAIALSPECHQATYENEPKNGGYPPIRVSPRLIDSRLLTPANEVRVELSLVLNTNEVKNAHVLTLIDWQDDWRIESIDGVEFEGTLPSRKVVVFAGTGIGTLKLVHSNAGRLTHSPYWPPVLVETLIDEVKLQSLLEGRTNKKSLF